MRDKKYGSRIIGFEQDKDLFADYEKVWDLLIDCLMLNKVPIELGNNVLMNMFLRYHKELGGSKKQLHQAIDAIWDHIEVGEK